MTFQTEIEFRLPKGYLGSDGVLQKDGIMRLATAADEILPLKDPRVQQNPAYLTIIVLARVITRLGGLDDINTKIIEGLYASDLNYLQELYERFNGNEEPAEPVREGYKPVAVNGDFGHRGFGVLGEA